MVMLILKSNGTQGGVTLEAVCRRESGEEAPKRMERTEAAVAEILGEAAALNLFKFHFTKPHLSLTAVQIRVLLLLFFPHLGWSLFPR